MDAGHILLGRPWEFDRAVVHDGRKNTYSFMLKNIKVTLLPTKEQFPKRTQEKGSATSLSMRRFMEVGKI